MAKKKKAGAKASNLNTEESAIYRRIKQHKPKFKKMPPMPKASASAASWERYAQRCKEVEAHNANEIAKANESKAKAAAVAKSVVKSKAAINGVKSASY